MVLTCNRGGFSRLNVSPQPWRFTNNSLGVPYAHPYLFACLHVFVSCVYDFISSCLSARVLLLILCSFPYPSTLLSISICIYSSIDIHTAFMCPLKSASVFPHSRTYFCVFWAPVFHIHVFLPSNYYVFIFQLLCVYTCLFLVA